MHGSWPCSLYCLLNHDNGVHVLLLPPVYVLQEAGLKECTALTRLATRLRVLKGCPQLDLPPALSLPYAFGWGAEGQEFLTVMPDW